MVVVWIITVVEEEEIMAVFMINAIRMPGIMTAGAVTTKNVIRRAVMIGSAILGTARIRPPGRSLLQKGIRPLFRHSFD